MDLLKPAEYLKILQDINSTVTQKYFAIFSLK